jgi:hypothetical protein
MLVATFFHFKMSVGPASPRLTNEAQLGTLGRSGAFSSHHAISSSRGNPTVDPEPDFDPGAQRARIWAAVRATSSPNAFHVSRGLETNAKSAFTRKDATMLHRAMMT